MDRSPWWGLWFWAGQFWAHRVGSMHPLHPIIVHFPIACFVLSTLANFIGAVLGPDLQIAGINLAAHARLLLWIGVSVSPIAVVLGAVDHVRFRHEWPGANDVVHHAGWMGCALVLYLLSGLLREAGHFMSALVAEATGFVCLIVGGLAASRIVYPHTHRQRRSRRGIAQTSVGMKR